MFDLTVDFTEIDYPELSFNELLDIAMRNSSNDDVQKLAKYINYLTTMGVDSTNVLREENNNLFEDLQRTKDTLKDTENSLSDVTDELNDAYAELAKVKEELRLLKRDILPRQGKAGVRQKT